ncbi:reverse transcriptase, partial [Phytophthora palmivora]
MVRESKSPHSTSTFCVRKPNGKWRLVHAYNKLNNATVPAQTPIPRKDVLLNNMSGCTLYSALDLGLSNAPATFNRLVTQLFRPLRTFAQDIFVHSRAEDGQTAMEVHLRHLRRGFEVMRANKLYANIDKCKDADWIWERQHQDAFDSIKASLQVAPVLSLPDENKSFSVVCDASDYAIGCALLQKDDERHERAISFQSRQLKTAERNYPVHDKELLAM